jgi:hemolysin D
LVFKTQVALTRSVMQIGKRQVKLTPGMSVTVEVKTGTRRVIEFFLAPLLRYKQESIRER